MSVLQNTFSTFQHLLIEAVPLVPDRPGVGAALEAWLRPEWVECWGWRRPPLCCNSGNSGRAATWVCPDAGSGWKQRLDWRLHY